MLDVTVSLVADALGVDALGSVLSAIWMLCEQMQEAKEASIRVHDRLADILEELRHTKQLPTHAKLEKYALMLEKYREFLRSSTNKSLVWRLLQSSQVMDEIKTINEEIDTLVVLLQLSTSRLLVEWKQQWEHDCEHHMQLLMTIASNSERVLREVQGTRAQNEALTTLKYEFEKSHIARTDEMNDKKHRAIDPPPTEALVQRIVQTTKLHVRSLHRTHADDECLVDNLTTLSATLKLDLT